MDLVHVGIIEQQVQRGGHFSAFADLPAEHEYPGVVGAYRHLPAVHVGRHHAGWQHAAYCLAPDEHLPGCVMG